MSHFQNHTQHHIQRNSKSITYVIDYDKQLLINGELINYDIETIIQIENLFCIYGGSCDKYCHLSCKILFLIKLQYPSNMILKDSSISKLDRIGITTLFNITKLRYSKEIDHYTFINKKEENKKQNSTYCHDNYINKDLRPIMNGKSIKYDKKIVYEVQELLKEYNKQCIKHPNEDKLLLSTKVVILSKLGYHYNLIICKDSPVFNLDHKIVVTLIDNILKQTLDEFNDKDPTFIKGRLDNKPVTDIAKY